MSTLFLPDVRELSEKWPFASTKFKFPSH
jgi:hypothetical protein